MQLAAFKLTDKLILQSAGNGGWTVQQAGAPGEVPALLGAFSNDYDMLSALAWALLGEGASVTAPKGGAA